jgi:hypothetical protein
MFTFKVVYIHYIQGLCQSWLGTADYALLIVVDATTRLGCMAAAAKFKPPIFPSLGFALSNTAWQKRGRN